MVHVRIIWFLCSVFVRTTAVPVRFLMNTPAARSTKPVDTQLSQATLLIHRSGALYIQVAYEIASLVKGAGCRLVTHSIYIRRQMQKLDISCGWMLPEGNFSIKVFNGTVLTFGCHDGMLQQGLAR